ncbi:transcription factor SPT20 homolog isoform X2 [Chironomus tepperi]|uniref:transcription factor SPT20 homolog isoform X2 n=1 Tax=Chironomus tepperi TaxID=113505 RepID=UPI00391F8372
MEYQALPESLLKREEGGGQIIIQAMAQPQQLQIQQQSVEQRQMDHDEKKMRRQIANSNERRRMQSINAGFQSLRQLLPHHEGEKLSKAAILQQTAEYIDRLELEKQQLIAANQHLQRLVDSMGGTNNNNNNECPPQQIIQQITSSPSTGTAIKKRKLDQVMTVQTISDSSDEGLGSMSPEPVTQMIFQNGTNASSTITKTHLVSASVTTINVKDYVNLQNQMETERRHRIQLEEQLKQLEMQVYSSQHQQQQQQVQQQQQQQQQQSPQLQPNYQHPEEIDEVDGHIINGTIEEKIIIRQPDGQDIQYIGTVPHSSQFVVVSTSTPGSSPKHVTIVNDDDDNSRTLSSDELHKEDDVKLVLRKVNPKLQQIRMPSILEQAIKAEPKVEVERINSPCIMPMIEENVGIHSPPIHTQRITSPPTAAVTIRTTYPNNSHQRPNLETIVEAIRHLEGDAFDMDEETATTTATIKPQQQQQHIITQEVPLALTTSNKYQQQTNGQVKEPFKFRQSATSQSGLPTFVSVPSHQQQQQQLKVQQYQQRPGVIVVKQNS